MRNPDWFILIQQWRLKGMGAYGVTLPFLVGALGYKASETKLGAQHVSVVLNDIIEHPVEGYVTEVRWCSDIGAPVLTVNSGDSVPERMPFESFFPCPNGEGQSLGFSQNIHSMFGLDCKDAEECFKKLLNYAAKFVAKEQYSRARSVNGRGFEYGSFCPEDLEYIQVTIMNH